MIKREAVIFLINWHRQIHKVGGIMENIDVLTDWSRAQFALIDTWFDIHRRNNGDGLCQDRRYMVEKYD